MNLQQLYIFTLSNARRLVTRQRKALENSYSRGLTINMLKIRQITKSFKLFKTTLTPAARGPGNQTRPLNIDLFYEFQHLLRTRIER